MAPVVVPGAKAASGTLGTIALVKTRDGAAPRFPPPAHRRFTA